MAQQRKLFRYEGTPKGGGFIDSVSLELPADDSLLEDYPFTIPAIRALRRLQLHPCVTFLTGENGSGKSTLLEAIAVKLDFSAEGGTRNMQYATRDTHSPLHEYLRISRLVPREKWGWFLRAESFYTMANAAESLHALGSFGWKSPHMQSHGEAFLSLLTELDAAGLYLFDEPEAALSTQRQMSALVQMHRLCQAGSQFIVATHSPILLAYPYATILLCDDAGLHPVKYEETDAYRLTLQFLKNHPRMLEMLLEDEKED
ncbi:MAG TPA: AAA family ATPase [Verrucomicrobiales bacterium]|jgi:predicted ATPase|nr:AAA family ATPase [Verrucomicrobiales bacterium]